MPSARKYRASAVTNAKPTIGSASSYAYIGLGGIRNGDHFGLLKSARKIGVEPEAEANPDNVASTALLESLGFKLEGFLRAGDTG